MPNIRILKFGHALIAVCSAAPILICAPAARAQVFTPGNLVVSVEGNGSNTAASGTGGANALIYLDNQAAPLTLYEYTATVTSQPTPVATLQLPQTQSGLNSAIS